MKCFLIFLTGIFLFSFASAQSAVKAAVQKLFTGIKNSDAAIIQSAFADSTILQTITRNKEGKIVVVNETVQVFPASVAQLSKEAADEQIRFDVIRIDGTLAIV